jgi:hypothetical protein
MRVTRTIGVSECIDHITFAGCRRWSRTSNRSNYITASINNEGGVGATASAGQFTVEAPSAGKTKSGMSMV